MPWWPLVMLPIAVVLAVILWRRRTPPRRRGGAKIDADLYLRLKRRHG